MSPTLSNIVLISRNHPDFDDTEIQKLLHKVFVDGGFTAKSDADEMFSTDKIRGRGLLIGAYDNQNSNLAGMIVFVPYDNPSIKMADAELQECELHLLGVLPEYRGIGLGNLLVNEAIREAKLKGCSKLILWTQETMKNAQALYERNNFSYVKNMSKNEKEFKVYELECS